DEEKIAVGGGLKHGAAAKLVSEARSRDVTLSEQEIQRRLRCARAYPMESQIRQAMTDFKTWFDLIQAGFPPYPALDGEAPADYRTRDERRTETARRLLEFAGEQETLFPLDRFEPVEASLKDLVDYAAEMHAMTTRFH